MAFLKFLKTATVVAAPVTVKKVSNVQRNPNPLFLGFRVWKDGSVYPSQALVDKFSLEYQQMIVSKKAITPKLKEGEVADPNATPKYVNEYTPLEGAVPNYGLDVMDSRNWPQLKSEGDNKAILIAITPKAEPKIDLFGRASYDEAGKPITSVMEQGSNTFGKDFLLGALTDIYGITLSGELPYVDLQVSLDVDLKVICPNGIFLFPKTVSRGEKKGSLEFVRRENVSVFGLEPIVAETEAVPTSDGSNMQEEEDASLQIQEAGGVEEETTA